MDGNTEEEDINNCERHVNDLIKSRGERVKEQHAKEHSDCIRYYGTSSGGDGQV